MKMKSVRKTAVVATGAALAGLVAATQPANAALMAGTDCSFSFGCSLNDVIAGGGLQVGNILFSDFTAQFTPVSQYPNPGDLISLLPTIDSTNPNKVGMGISAALFADSTATPIKNLTFKYKASGLNGFLLSGISGTLDGAVTAGTGRVSLAETARDMNNNTIGQMLLGNPATTLTPISGSDTFDSPVQMAFITKDITSDAGVNGIAHFSSLINTSTAVPTPALLPGLLGFGATVLRKRKKAAAIA